MILATLLQRIKKRLLISIVIATSINAVLLSSAAFLEHSIEESPPVVNPLDEAIQNADPLVKKIRALSKNTTRLLSLSRSSELCGSPSGFPRGLTACLR